MPPVDPSEPHALPGRPGNLNPEQQHVLDKFRKTIMELGIFAPDRHDDACLCRFLRARKWDFNETLSMFLEAEKWRRENHVDELYETFTFPEREAVSKLYPKFYHKTDVDGRPVYIEQFGALDLKQLFQVTTPERLIQQLIVEYERFQRERLPVCSAVRDTLIETSCTIMDLKNVGVSQFWRVSSYVQQASKIGQYYYPETMGKFYVINAPYIFSTVWSVVKGWLDPVTTDKIQILGSSYMGELKKQIPLDHIPSIIGGECHCPGGCALSDAGPWNTPKGREIIASVVKEKEMLVRAWKDGTYDGKPADHANQGGSAEGETGAGEGAGADAGAGAGAAGADAAGADAAGAGAAGAGAARAVSPDAAPSGAAPSDAASPAASPTATSPGAAAVGSPGVGSPDHGDAHQALSAPVTNVATPITNLSPSRTSPGTPLAPPVGMPNGTLTMLNDPK
ncbi:hypothetical protein MSPP1_004067 [Malassezia sp. CBS 17886]|nr:hypothetical protein MSPP1_004067 [Malassezia sp. CBS 17886]